ncbi:hypothetical protein EJ06DRAFT_484846 [Trichodelitschia bisporula]|uniref:RRM domain-containing protein n=1 Tax=Trichodelitschia bisporula TaxID=703511 RepID=A0A6G1HIH1_9PEZI|nr:hypothetical protein EJ06DRAFT_484846 [Trichodelitschia bisporula]
MASNTVYVKRLPEDKSAATQSALLTALHTVFSHFGPVVEIVTKRSLHRKGQAFVVFEKSEDAAEAVRALNGFPIASNGWPMQCELARSVSDATVARSGDEQELELHRRRRLAEKERKQAALLLAEKQRAAPTAPEPTTTRTIKPSRGAGLKSTGGANAVVPDEYLPPNRTLFVRDVPEEYDVEALAALFGPFEGFREARLVPGRKGIAFIEYEAEAGAISAKENMAGRQVGDKVLKVTYQRQ